MTQPPCTKQQSGLRGTITCTSPSSILQLLACLTQEAVIHLATDGSRGATATLAQSLSCRASTHSTSSARASNQPRVDPSSTYITRMYGNSLDSATSAGDQGTRHLSVSLGHSRMVEVTSLVARQCKPPPDSTMDSIIRETNERAACEE